MQAAFAQSIMDSTGGLFEEIIDIEAAERRRRRLQTTYSPTLAPTLAPTRGMPTPGVDSVDGVEISYTGVARVDGTDGEAASAALLEQSMDAMTLAVYDGSFLATLQASDPSFAAVTMDVEATQAAIEAASYTFVVTTPRPIAAPTPRPTPRPTPDGAIGSAESSSESTSSGGSGGGSDGGVIVAGGGAAAGAILLLAAAAFFFYRRGKGSAANKKPMALSGDVELGDIELEEGNDRSTMLARHKETTAVVERGMTVTSALLSAASGLPLVGPLCQVVQGILGDVEEFSEKADDVLVAARRVIDVLDVVDLMSKNVSKCSDGKDIAQANMQRLIDLLKEFHAAVRAFGQKGWLKRAFTMQSHVKKLGLIDKRIVEQLGVFRLSYRLAIDSQMMERTYQIEQSIAALVAKRVVEKGESEEAAAAALSEDAVAITSVAVDARVPPTEIAVEMREFRLEVKEGLSKLDKKMNKMLDAVHNQIVAARLEGHRVAAWSLTARFSQHGRVLADKGLREELSGAPDSLVDLRAGWMVEPWTSSSSSRSLSPSKPAWDATRSSWRPSRRARRATSGSWRPSRLATNATRLFDETSTSSAGRCGRRSRGSWSSA